MEDQIADTTAFEGTRWLQVLKFEKYFAVKLDVSDESNRADRLESQTSLLLLTALETRSMGFRSKAFAALPFRSQSPCWEMSSESAADQGAAGFMQICSGDGFAHDSSLKYPKFCGKLGVATMMQVSD